ncbi:MAG: hypothetical protein H7331_01875 [Bacteroidia bacterium]|nr:hypothetical protein [Bacteroidia bacterium]
MKNYLLAIALVSIWISKVTAQNNVGIGTTTPNTKAILELMSNDKGFLTPRVTTTEMLGISSSGVVPNGLLVFNTTTECFNYWKTSALVWKDMCSGGLGNSKDTIVIMHVDTLVSNIIITDSLFANIINVDSLFAHFIKTDSIYAHLGSFDSLYVNGKNILQTISDSITAQAWLLKGNNASATNKLGTLNAQDLHIYAGGTERITILNSAGQIGISTLSPTYGLDIRNTGTSFLTTTGWAKGVHLTSQSALVWDKSAGTNYFFEAKNATGIYQGLVSTDDGLSVPNYISRIDEITGDWNLYKNAYVDGSVGIATLTPTEKLDVVGSIKFSNALMPAGIAGITGDVLVSKGAGLAPQWQNGSTLGTTLNGVAWTLLGNSGTTAGTHFLGTTDPQDLVFKTNALERVRVTSTGNVGIGTATPIAKLHLKGFDGRDIVFSPGTLTPTLNFTHNDNGNINARWAYIAGSLQDGALGKNYGHLIFGTAPSAAGNPATLPRMIIDGEGNTYVNALNYYTRDVFSVRANNSPFATSNTVGAYAISGYSSAGVSVYGEDNSTGDGVSGSSVTGNGVFGRTNANLSGGATALNTNVNGTGMTARGDFNAGDSWWLPTQGSGGAFNGDDLGVVGYANNSVSGLPAGTTSAGGYFRDSITVINKTYAWVAAYNSGTKYKILGDGVVSTIVKDKKDKEYIMYCTESPEVFFDDYGKGELVNGEAIIQLDELYSYNIIVNEKHPLRVFVQLEGDCNGVFVINKTAQSFTVKELNKGTANVKFSYHVIGNRKDEKINDKVVSKYEDNRFAPAEGLHLPSTDISKNIKDNIITKTLKKQ